MTCWALVRGCVETFVNAAGGALQAVAARSGSFRSVVALEVAERCSGDLGLGT